MSQDTLTTPVQSRLLDLIGLAQEPTPDKRRILLRELTDQFFGTAHLEMTESETYGDILTELTSQMERAVRQELAERFSARTNAPARLIRSLAYDEVAQVASPVLQSSPVLTDQDLLGVVQTRGQAHMRAVSRRAIVSETVSDAIVEHGDDETLGVLLSNQRASLSRRASETAIDRAKVNPQLHEAAVSRANLPPDLLNEMYFVVESRLRQKILEQNALLDPALIENAVAAGRARIATADGNLPSNYAESLARVEKLRASNSLTPQVLANFLRSGDQTDFIIALSLLADIDFHMVRRILISRQLDALAVICRAANMDRPLFLTYAVVLLGSDANAIGKARSFGSLYQALSIETAQRTLRFWRLRTAIQTH